MKNSISEQSFYIESEEEDDEHLEKHENEEEGNESDFSNEDNNDDETNRPNSLTSAWPQSYRYLVLYLNLPLDLVFFSHVD